jgi:septum formation protein
MRHIILASASPRRKELLGKMGVAFEVVPSEYEERLDDHRSTEEVAAELGLGKALAVAEKHPDALVIGSDTIVTLNGKQLGKPKDRADARELLRAHGNQTVTVTTSLALVCKETGLEEVTTDTSTVVFRPHNESVVEIYLKSNNWKDKAGGWGMQDGAAQLIDHIEGEYDTILGLPTKLLYEMLTRQGIKSTPVDIEPPVRRKERS